MDQLWPFLVFLRINLAPTVGYEEDAGSHTTHHFMYPESAKNLAANVSFVLVPFKTLDLVWITSALSTGQIRLWGHTHTPRRSPQTEDSVAEPVLVNHSGDFVAVAAISQSADWMCVITGCVCLPSARTLQWSSSSAWIKTRCVILMAFCNVFLSNLPTGAAGRLENLSSNSSCSQILFNYLESLPTQIYYQLIQM